MTWLSNLFLTWQPCLHLKLSGTKQKTRTRIDLFFHSDETVMQQTWQHHAKITSPLMCVSNEAEGKWERLFIDCFTTVNFQRVLNEVPLRHIVFSHRGLNVTCFWLSTSFPLTFYLFMKYRHIRHHSGVQIALLPYSKKVQGSIPGPLPFWVEFACSPRVCKGLLQVLQFSSHSPKTWTLGQLENVYGAMTAGIPPLSGLSGVNSQRWMDLAQSQTVTHQPCQKSFPITSTI